MHLKGQGKGKGKGKGKDIGNSRGKRTKAHYLDIAPRRARIKLHIQAISSPYAIHVGPM